MPQRKIKILIIDDEPDFISLVKMNLKLMGDYRILTAKSGNKGMWVARCRWHKPHLILLDIMMPGLDGFELLRMLKEDRLTKYIPVVMLTARADMASKVKAEGLYCDDYLVKPVEADTLKAKIDEVLAKHGIK